MGIVVEALTEQIGGVLFCLKKSSSLNFEDFFLISTFHKKWDLCNAFNRWILTQVLKIFLYA